MIFLEFTKTLMLSKDEGKRYSTDQITSTISKAKQATGPDQKTSSLLHAGNIKSSLNSITQTVNDNAPTSVAGEHHSHSINEETSSTNLGPIQASFYQPIKTKQAMELTISRYQTKSLAISNVLKISDTVNPMEAKFSTVETGKVSPSTKDNLHIKATETNLPFISNSQTVTKGIISSSTITNSVHLMSSTTLQNDKKQISFSTNDLIKLSIASRSETSFSTASKIETDPSSSNATKQTQYSTTVIEKSSDNMKNNHYTTTIPKISSSSLITTDSMPSVPSLQTEELIATIQSTNSIHPQSLMIENGSTIMGFTHSVSLDNNIMLTSSPTVTPDNVGHLSTVMPSTKSSISAVENTTKLWKSTSIENAASTSVLPLISPTSDATTPLNTSNIVGQLHSYSTTATSPIHESTSAVVFAISEDSTNLTLDSSHMTTAATQPTKTSITPVVSSSVTIPPYYLPWSNWTACTRECGGGYTHQTRNCSKKEQCAGLGSSVNKTICNLHKCNGKLMSRSRCKLHSLLT